MKGGVLSRSALLAGNAHWYPGSPPDLKRNSYIRYVANSARITVDFLYRSSKYLTAPNILYLQGPDQTKKLRLNLSCVFIGFKCVSLRFGANYFLSYNTFPTEKMSRASFYCIVISIACSDERHSFIP